MGTARHWQGWYEKRIDTHGLDLHVRTLRWQVDVKVLVMVDINR